MNNLVSVIMPSFNSEKYIGDSIRSVLTQTYKNFELIVVDDSSTDRTIDIIKGFNDDRIKLFINDTNRGAAFSRNLALKAAKGRFIAFLDSDDKWFENKTELQVDFMISNNYGFTYTNYVVFNEKKKMFTKRISAPGFVSKKMLLNYCFMGCLTVMIDRSIIDIKTIPDNVMKRNDYALWLTMLSKDDISVLLDETLAIYTIRDGDSISNISKFRLLKYHYFLFRNTFKYSIIVSLILSINNAFFSIYKKIFYEKRIK